MKHILEIDSVILEFHRQRVLQDIYLKNETGTITGLLGRNGTGKSCLLNILYGTLNPGDKSIRIDNTAIQTNNREPASMRYLPQFNFIPKSLTVKRVLKDFNIDFSGFLFHFPEFEKHILTKLKALAGGERRLIETYVILMSDSMFCLLDEPFSHIMPLHVETLKALIIKEKERKGIIVSDHLFQHIFELSDTLYLIEGGKIHSISGMQEAEELGYINPVQTHSNDYKSSANFN